PKSSLQSLLAHRNRGSVRPEMEWEAWGDLAGGNECHLDPRAAGGCGGRPGGLAAVCGGAGLPPEHAQPAGRAPVPQPQELEFWEAVLHVGDYK
ncbi:unnamed protein product, partial [Heterosigma akashiwo]